MEHQTRPKGEYVQIGLDDAMNLAEAENMIETYGKRDGPSGLLPQSESLRPSLGISYELVRLSH